MRSFYPLFRIKSNVRIKKPYAIKSINITEVALSGNDTNVLISGVAKDLLENKSLDEIKGSLDAVARVMKLAGIEGDVGAVKDLLEGKNDIDSSIIPQDILKTRNGQSSMA
jgi:hypothetical protein